MLRRGVPQDAHGNQITQAMLPERKESMSVLRFHVRFIFNVKMVFDLHVLLALDKESLFRGLVDYGICFNF